MKLRECIDKKEKITIGYIGGSITEQAGYRPVFTEHLKAACPNTVIEEINAAMGGTNSFLGVHRADRDLASKKPDIAVIEFAVNDFCDKPKEYFKFFGRTYEGIIRKFLKANPNMLIIGVGLTTLAINEKFYDKNDTPYTSLYHKIACDNYNIPFVNVGEMLYNHMKANNEKMIDYTTDNVHTNEKGGKFYGDALWNELKDYDFNIKTDAKPKWDNNFENATLYFPENLNDGWHKGQWGYNNKHEDYIYSNTPGSEIAVDFFGSAFGIYCTTEKTSGNIMYSIDGGEWKERSTWDNYAISFPRLHYYTLEDSLEKGKHTVKIKVSVNKDEQSEGYYLRIIAFLVEKD